MKLLIWGTGEIAKQTLHNGINGEITGFIETIKVKDYFDGKPVFGIDEIPKGYDYIIVANTYTAEIYNECIKRKLDVDKIIFLKNIIKQQGCQNLNIISNILGEKNYTNYCSEFKLISYTFFEKDVETYNQLNKRNNFKAYQQYMWPIINEKYAMAGDMSNYFWQDLWAARLIYKTGVKKHYDIGSRIDGFIAHLLAMNIEVSLIDIREFPGKVENLHTIVDDATSLRQIPNDSVESMSALCSLEHFGLGRYGDPIDPEACFKCFDNIQRKLKKGGELYISLPVGKERVEFNAHRVFYASTVIDCFSSLHLEEFSCTAAGMIEYNVEIHKYDTDKHNGNFRYGLFHFVKK